MNRDFINHLIDTDYKPFFYKKNINFELDNPNRISILVWAKDCESAFEQIVKLYARANQDKIKEISFDEAIAFIKNEEENIDKQVKKIQSKMNNYLHSFNHLLDSDDFPNKEFDDFKKKINSLLSDDLFKI